MSDLDNKNKYNLTPQQVEDLEVKWDDLSRELSSRKPLISGNRPSRELVKYLKDKGLADYMPGTVVSGAGRLLGGSSKIMSMYKKHLINIAVETKESVYIPWNMRLSINELDSSNKIFKGWVNRDYRVLRVDTPFDRKPWYSLRADYFMFKIWRGSLRFNLNLNTRRSILRKTYLENLELGAYPALEK